VNAAAHSRVATETNVETATGFGVRSSAEKRSERESTEDDR
jgi:hypothetical protein